MLFVNLPVRDLAVARDFYGALGFRANEAFSDERTAALSVDESIVVVLRAPERFAELVSGEVGDPARGTTVVNCLSAGSREEVDALVAAALAAGGRPWQPARSDDISYTGSFADPDGNAWQFMWMGQQHVVN